VSYSWICEASVNGRVGKSVLATAAAAAVCVGSIVLPAAAAVADDESADRPVDRPAAAALPAAAPRAVTAGADASLSGLVVGGGNVSGLSHAFATGTHHYQIIANDYAQSFTITPTATDPEATVVVAADGQDYPLSSGVATVSLPRGRTNATVTVTSADTSATEVYRITAWRQAAPTPTIVRLTDTVATPYGGNRITVVLANGDLPPGCSVYSPGPVWDNYLTSSAFDPATGLTTDGFQLSRASNLSASTENLNISIGCWVPAGIAHVTSNVIKKNAITYVPFTVDSVDIPTPFSSGSIITLRGQGLSSNAALTYWMTDADGNLETDVWTWGWTGNGNDRVILDYPWGESWFKTGGPKTFYVGFCPNWRVNDTCTVLYSHAITFVAPVPTDVSFSPSSGPLTGGTTVRLRGRYLVAGQEEDLGIKVGDQTVSSYRTIKDASRGRTMAQYTSDYDTVEFTTPAAAVPGPVSITLTNEVGTAVARGTFNYGAKPTIATITPDTVATSGGSVVTITGTGFGTTGRPTVVLGGVKSPQVTRVNATTLTAVLPMPAGSAGTVDVSVVSAQGGGASAPAQLTLVAPSTLPTVGSLSPVRGHGGDSVTITGTGFGAAHTVGVSVGGQWAVVDSSTATSVTIEVPPGAGTGAQDVVVGAVTGAVTSTGALTVLPDDGIATVTPSTIPSYATGTAAKIVLDGAGFGTTGTVKVGAAAAVAYTATDSGTRISAVSVPTAVAGAVPIVVTPTGSHPPLRGNVTVTAPTISYLGADPYNSLYGPPDPEHWPGTGGMPMTAVVAGGTKVRIEGTGFSTGGVLKVAGATVATTSWADTAITFTAPAHAEGAVPVVVTPTSSTLTATRPTGLTYVTPAVAAPTFTRVASVVDASHGARNQFDPRDDTSDAFTLTGTNLAGTDAAVTRLSITDGTDTFTVVPTDVGATSLTFAAPRAFTHAGFKTITLTTDLGSFYQEAAIEYTRGGPVVTPSPWNGLCLRADASASGSVTYHPASVTINSSDPGVFGTGGTASVDGVAITTTSWADTQVVLSMSDLASDLADPWGGKTILLTPTDTALPPQRIGFVCGVTPAVTTTVNSDTADLTVAAGTAFTMGFTTSGILGTFTAAAPTAYEYVTAADYQAHGFTNSVHAGVPAAAGEYYVRVALSRATYDTAKYLGFTPAPVHITITGTPVTLTPVSDNGASFTYLGQLEAGTDIHYTATTTADPITAVSWQYRDSVCESQAADAGWIDGLPKDVARSSTGCGGDGSTVSSWDVRVKSITMDTTGTDRSIFYEATTPVTQIHITPRNLTVAAVRADKVYDGTTAAPLGDLEVTGAVEGDDVALANAGSAGTFADADAGVNKPVTLAHDLTLAGSGTADYTLTNPRPTILGTISKAPATLALAAAPSSVLLSQHTPVTITATVTDSRTNQPVAPGANAAAVVLTSATPNVCSISGTTVTALTAGTCTISGTEPTSTNYLAATAASDPTTGTETIDIQVFPAPQPISVVADDLTVAVGDTIDPTSEVSGLLDGDSISGLTYQYYSGTTLLSAAPTDPGSYQVMPTGGTLTAASTLAYSNPTAFGYVAGTLTITALPPTIATITPSVGQVMWPTDVTITGTRLDTVRSVRIGTTVLRAGDFTVAPDGSTLTFTTPRASSPGPVDLTLVAGTATATDTFTYIVNAPGAPTRLGVAGIDEGLTVTFLPPVNNGGSAILRYEVSTDGGDSWVELPTAAAAGGARTATLTGLTNGTSYPVQVRAVNVADAGASSATVTGVPGVTTAPAPTRVTATGLDEEILVGFVPPATGGPFTGYLVSVDGGRTWHPVRTAARPGGARAVLVGPVQNGVAYAVSVRVVNAHGAGFAAPAVRVIPNAPPLGTVKPNNPDEVPIPADPNAYRGPMVWTKARDTAYNGVWAHPIVALGHRQLIRPEAATLSGDGLFGFDNAQLTPAGIAQVRALAAHLRLAHTVVCEGYTDYAGDTRHEDVLSAQRAVAVCTGLVRYGARVRLATRGYGPRRPAVIGGTPQGRAGNRRVVVIVAA
jgi:outer membrane protein OmpA-like peptidoglycan-associated protein